MNQRNRLCLVGLILLALIGCRSSTRDDPIDPRSADYRTGQREAEAEWLAGTQTIYRYGLRCIYVDGIDEETGLPTKTIAGCDVGVDIMNTAAGHNARIAELVAEQGLPASSRKPWMNQILNPEANFPTGTAPIELKPNAEGIAHGDCVLSLIAQPTGDPDGSHYLHLRLVAGQRQSDPGFPWGHYGAGKTELLWGPEGADIAFFRWTDLHFPNESFDNVEAGYAVLDLRSGQWLRAKLVRKQTPAPTQGN